MSDKNKNLIPASHKLTVDEQSKGGQVSGAARRERADLKKELQNLLDAEFKVKGKKMSGAAAITYNLFSIALDESNKSAVRAIQLIFETLGAESSTDVPIIVIGRSNAGGGENNAN